VHREVAKSNHRRTCCGGAALLVDDLEQNPAVDKFNSLAALEAILRRGCP